MIKIEKLQHEKVEQQIPFGFVRRLIELVTDYQLAIKLHFRFCLWYPRDLYFLNLCIYTQHHSSRFIVARSLLQSQTNTKLSFTKYCQSKWYRLSHRNTNSDLCRNHLYHGWTWIQYRLLHLMWERPQKFLLSRRARADLSIWYRNKAHILHSQFSIFTVPFQ